MCHPSGVPNLVRLRVRDLAVLQQQRRRWLLLQAPVAVETTANLHAAAAAARRVGEAAAGGGNGGGDTQWCLCSPTQHPGSFRCRQHHAEYVWGGGRNLRKDMSSN
ncbi:hypothetical protein C1H46_014787 [Malus baccata]|uniref:Uncharacterized protein n=1 Tax=Malus baccata TaxID=106549 RepID=A0A540MLL8_MALBA|nr:hypothetical protein C1H46_014787 [Malus baccata]